MSEIKKFSTYCVECDNEVVATIEHRSMSMRIRGQETNYDAAVAICPSCGSVIADSRIEGKNLAAAYTAYRSANNLLQPEEIKEIRNRYGLSLRDFSRFLGFGEQTVSRYETGALQDEAHDGMMRLASSHDGAAQLLAIRRDQLPANIVAAAERFIASRPPRRFAVADFNWPPLNACTPSRTNGYRAFDWDRAGAAVVSLASRCTNLYKTKLQKAMFFLDYYCFGMSGSSLTGIEYAHADYGPVINDKDVLLCVLQRQGKIELVQRGYGEIVTPLLSPDGIFDERELGYIDLVAGFVDTFETASGISEFSHSLDAWKGTKSGEIIDYPSYAKEVVKAIDSKASACAIKGTGRRR